MTDSITLIPVAGLPEISPRCDFVQLALDAITGSDLRLQEGDVLVISSKAIAKWQGTVVRAADVAVGEAASSLSTVLGKTPAYCQVVLDQSREIIRLAPGVIICRTGHGFVLANAGVDASNTGVEEQYIVLPDDLDMLAESLRQQFFEKSGCRIAIIVSDTFGRPWRNGQIDLAVGCAGLQPMRDYRGTLDDNGRQLSHSITAIADELASAADLVSGKTSRIPVVIIRNYPHCADCGCAAALVMPRENDLFGKIEERVSPMERLLQRRSIRRYDGRDIPHEVRKRIIDAGLNAPSAHDGRPWRFVVITSARQKCAFRTMLELRHRNDMEKTGFAAAAINTRLLQSRELFSSASAFIVIFAKTQMPDNPLAKGTETEALLTAQSVAMAGGQMLVAASFLDIGACWFAAPLFCQQEVSAFCQIDESYVPQGMIALGYPAEPPKNKPLYDHAQFVTYL